jgi:2-polyprenyl-6-methoxyphenol hydroxylase-like FAD-dependent oxidoreductase
MPGRSIAIAGCGIAGLAAAALLAREGERITVFDRMEAPAPIGSGLILQPVGLAVLDEIGMAARIRALGAPIRRLYGRTEPSNRIVLDVRYRALGGGAGEGLGVHRGALFEVLHDAAREAGAEMVGGRDIRGADGGRLTFADGSQSAKFDLVIDALGVRSPLSRRQPLPPLPFGALWCNLDWPQGEAAAIFDANALEQRYEAARKMVGILPVGSVRTGAPRQAAFFWSLKHTGLDAWRATPLEAWKDDVRKLWPQAAPFIDQIVDREKLIFAAYAHGTRASPLRGGVAHIGDSWHSASPQLGQGANMALLDALALARSVAVHPAIPDALEAYRRARVGHIRLYQLASWMFTPAYQSDSAVIAWVRDWLMAPVSRVWPAPKILAALVAGSIAAPLAAIEAIADG